MMKKQTAITLLCFLLLTLFSSYANAATDEGVANMIKEKPNIEQAAAAAKTNLTQAKSFYDQFHDNWLDVEDTVKSDSKAAYKDIETQMGQVEYAFMVNKQNEVISSLQNLQQVLDRFIKGQYTSASNEAEPQMTLTDFLTLLNETKASVTAQNKGTSLENIAKVRESWLSVEGNVVARSASVYSDSERDMVVINAMISDNKFDEADKKLGEMINYLTPLANKSAYTFWDAAMIPIREGLEALLVVGALLAFVKKSDNRHGKGKHWIWAGILSGLLLSSVLAIIVKFILSSGAFGTNNFLIAGFTGVFAAVMLLYMSYWLHSKSNTQQWNRYIETKTQQSLSTGNLVSLGVLSFLAVFREGTETVLFLIGMANQISTQQLLSGIVLGLGILGVIAYLMLFLGMRLPLRPFFLVSSLIVFYLCIKFMGLGVHSLQLAGTVPVSSSSRLPSIDFLGFYPSWQSTLPQLAIIVLALLFLLKNHLQKRKNTAISQ